MGNVSPSGNVSVSPSSSQTKKLTSSSSSTVVSTTEVSTTVVTTSSSATSLNGKTLPEWSTAIDSGLFLDSDVKLVQHFQPHPEHDLLLIAKDIPPTDLQTRLIQSHLFQTSSHSHERWNQSWNEHQNLCFFPKELWILIGEYLSYPIDISLTKLKITDTIPHRTSMNRGSITSVWVSRQSDERVIIPLCKGSCVNPEFSGPSITWSRTVQPNGGIYFSSVIRLGNMLITTPEMDHVKNIFNNCFHWLMTCSCHPSSPLFRLRQQSETVHWMIGQYPMLLRFFIDFTCENGICNEERWFELEDQQLSLFAVPVQGYTRDQLRRIFRNWYIRHRMKGRGYFDEQNTYQAGDIIIAGDIVITDSTTSRPSHVTEYEPEMKSYFIIDKPNRPPEGPNVSPLSLQKLHEESQVNEKAFLSLFDESLRLESKWVFLVATQYISMDMEGRIVGVGAFRLRYPREFHIQCSIALSEYLKE